MAPGTPKTPTSSGSNLITKLGNPNAIDYTKRDKKGVPIPVPKDRGDRAARRELKVAFDEAQAQGSFASVEQSPTQYAAVEISQPVISIQPAPVSTSSYNVQHIPPYQGPQDKTTPVSKSFAPQNQDISQSSFTHELIRPARDQTPASRERYSNTESLLPTHTTATPIEAKKGFFESAKDYSRSLLSGKLPNEEQQDPPQSLRNRTATPALTESSTQPSTEYGESITPEPSLYRRADTVITNVIDLRDPFTSHGMDKNAIMQKEEAMETRAVFERTPRYSESQTPQPLYDQRGYSGSITPRLPYATPGPSNYAESQTPRPSYDQRGSTAATSYSSATPGPSNYTESQTPGPTYNQRGSTAPTSYSNATPGPSDHAKSWNYGQTGQATTAIAGGASGFIVDSTPAGQEESQQSTFTRQDPVSIANVAKQQNHPMTGVSPPIQNAHLAVEQNHNQHPMTGTSPPVQVASSFRQDNTQQHNQYIYETTIEQEQNHDQQSRQQNHPMTGNSTPVQNMHLVGSFGQEQEQNHNQQSRQQNHPMTGNSTPVQNTHLVGSSFGQEQEQNHNQQSRQQNHPMTGNSTPVQNTHLVGSSFGQEQEQNHNQQSRQNPQYSQEQNQEPLALPHPTSNFGQHATFSQASGQAQHQNQQQAPSAFGQATAFGNQLPPAPGNQLPPPTPGNQLPPPAPGNQLPPPALGNQLPPAPGNQLPPPAPGNQLPPPALGNQLPPPAPGNQLPPPAPGNQLPPPAPGNQLPPPAPGNQLPPPALGNQLPPPAPGNQLPPPAPGNQLPPPAPGNQLPPPAPGNQLPPPAPGNQLPPPALGNQLPPPAPGNQLPPALGQQHQHQPPQIQDLQTVLNLYRQRASVHPRSIRVPGFVVSQERLPRGSIDKFIWKEVAGAFKLGRGYHLLLTYPSNDPSLSCYDLEAQHKHEGKLEEFTQSWKMTEEPDISILENMQYSELMLKGVASAKQVLLETENEQTKIKSIAVPSKQSNTRLLFLLPGMSREHVWFFRSAIQKRYKNWGQVDNDIMVFRSKTGQWSQEMPAINPKPRPKIMRESQSPSPQVQNQQPQYQGQFQQWQQPQFQGQYPLLNAQVQQANPLLNGQPNAQVWWSPIQSQQQIPNMQNQNSPLNAPVPLQNSWSPIQYQRRIPNMQNLNAPLNAQVPLRNSWSPIQYQQQIPNMQNQNGPPQTQVPLPNQYQYPPPHVPLPNIQLGQNQYPPPNVQPGQHQNPPPNVQPGQHQNPPPNVQPGQHQNPPPNVQPGQHQNPPPNVQPGQHQNPPPNVQPGQHQNPPPNVQPGQHQNPPPNLQPGQHQNPPPNVQPGQHQNPPPSVQPGQNAQVPLQNMQPGQHQNSPPSVQPGQNQYPSPPSYQFPSGFSPEGFAMSPPQEISSWGLTSRDQWEARMIFLESENRNLRAWREQNEL